MQYLKVDGREWPAHDPDVKRLFGLDRKAKWPVDGLRTVTIQGVECWVDPLRGDGRFRLRARCRCPACGDAMAIGRLAQHARHMHSVTARVEADLKKGDWTPE